MRKIASRIAGAAAVVTAVSAGLAYAQTADSPSTPTTTPRTAPPPKGEDLKSNSTASPYGPGGNNGSVYNPAIRSTGTSPGNVSSVEDPAAAPMATTATPPMMPPATTAMPAPAPMEAAPTMTPAPAPAAIADEGTRAARADRN